MGSFAVDHPYKLLKLALAAVFLAMAVSASVVKADDTSSDDGDGGDDVQSAHSVVVKIQP